MDHNNIIKFMKEFKIDYINRNDEMIIDAPSNTFAFIGHCKDMDDIKTMIVFALCRPIGKGLETKRAEMLLERVNDYFDQDLTREDMRLMYQELCYRHKLAEFKDFIKRGFPMDELKEGVQE